MIVCFKGNKRGKNAILAVVFKKYGILYCCKWADFVLKVICYFYYK